MFCVDSISCVCIYLPIGTYLTLLDVSALICHYSLIQQK